MLKLFIEVVKKIAPMMTNFEIWYCNKKKTDEELHHNEMKICTASAEKCINGVRKTLKKLILVLKKL